MVSKCARLAVAAAALLLPPMAAQAQMYGGNSFGNDASAGDGNGGLFRLDTETGVVLEQFTLVPSSGGAITGINSITVDPTTGIYYAILKQASTSGRTLATVDVQTQVATILGNLGDNFSSISFREDGQLFGVTGDGATVPETLYTIDKSNAAKTLARALGNGADGEVIAHHPGDDAFYHWSGNGTVVFERIADQPPYDITAVPVQSATDGEVFGATWDACRQRFLAHSISSRMSLWSTTGLISDQQPSTMQDIRGLALVGANTCDVDLAVEAVPVPAEPGVGEPAAAMFTVTNNGRARARATLLAIAPGGVLSTTSTAGCAEDPGGTPTCSLGVVLGGESRQVTLSGLFAAAGEVSATSSTASAETDASNDAARAIFGPIASVTPASGLITSEAGGSEQVSVVLLHAPDADVQIPVAAGNPDEASVAPAGLTFTPANWNVAQSVTATGVDDAVDDGAQPFAVLFGAAASTDAAFDGRDVPDAGGSNDDDDTAGIVVQSPAPLLTAETGASATFSVRLASEPVADVTVPVASDTPTEGNTDLAMLSFTPANWDTPQTVTLTGADDAVTDGTVDYAVTFGQAASADPLYDGQQPASLAARNVDDDSAAATGSVRFDSLCGIESSEGMGSLVLTVQRTGHLAVGVRVTTSDESAVAPDDYTAVDQTLTWGLLDETPRQVTIPLVADAVEDRGETFLVTLSQFSGGVQGAAPTQVRVTIRNGVLFGSGFETTGCPP